MTVQRASAQRGFTLLEVLVATAIMGVAVVGVMAGLSQTSRNASRLTQYDRATILARHTMDDLIANHSLPRNQQMEGTYTPQQSGGIQAGWQARIVVFESLPQPQPGYKVLDRIELSVWWMDGPIRRSFALEGYRRSVLRPEDVQTGSLP